MRVHRKMLSTVKTEPGFNLGPLRLKLLWCLPVILLVVPYATGFVSYQTALGTFPVNSALYASIVSAAVAVYGFFRKPIITLSISFFLGLLYLRFVDAVILGRAPNSLEQSPVTLFGFGVAYATALVCLTGDPHLLKWSAFITALGSLLIVSFLNIWEWHFPGYFSNVPGRSAGWLENANDAGIVICITLGVLLALQLPLWFNVSALAISALGVYVTLSRGGFIVWLLTCLSFIFVQARRGLKTIMLAFILLLAALLLVTQVFDFRTIADPDQIWRQGLLTGESSLDISQEGRLHLLLLGIDGIIQEPVVGYGTGASLWNPFAPHNQIVGVWLDNGLFGFALYCAALIFFAHDVWRTNPFLIVGSVPLLTEAVFSHNLLENKTYLFAWVMLSGLAWHSRRATLKVTVPSPIPVHKHGDLAPQPTQRGIS